MSRTDQLRTVSRNGQVSIPAAVRARWRADERHLPDKVVVVDMGEYVVVAPALKDPINQLRGKYAGRGPSSDQMRRQARVEDAAYEDRQETDRQEAQRKAASKGRRSA